MDVLTIILAMLAGAALAWLIIAAVVIQAFKTAERAIETGKAKMDLGRIGGGPQEADALSQISPSGWKMPLQGSRKASEASEAPPPLPTPYPPPGAEISASQRVRCRFCKRVRAFFH